jgi:hypothetical protein
MHNISGLNSILNNVLRFDFDEWLRTADMAKEPLLISQKMYDIRHKLSTKEVIKAKIKLMRGGDKDRQKIPITITA